MSILRTILAMISAIMAATALLSLATALFSAASVRTLTASHLKMIDDYMLSIFIPKNSIPGVGLAIVHGNYTFAKGYGMADLELSIPAGNHTLFGIGSISKTFTALTVVRVLQSKFPELGESVLDVPIRTLIPSYNFMLIDRFRSENMNFRDLLSHRVCVEMDSIGMFTNPYKSKADFVYRQRYAPEACSPRTKFYYHNGLYQVAAELAAAIANSTFEQLLDELFMDLGMNETSSIKESDDLDDWPNLSRPYYKQNGTFKRVNYKIIEIVKTAPAAGGIITSPADFIRYLTLQANSGKIGSKQIIPKEIMSWTRSVSNSKEFTSYKTSKSPDSLIYAEYGYGLGLDVGLYEGYAKYSHAGYLPPYLSLMTFVPELSIGIMTVTNDDPGIITNTTHDYLHAKFLNMITGIEKEPSVMDEPTEVTLSGKKVDFLQNTYLLQNWTQLPKNDSSLLGTYGNPLMGEFNITGINSTTMYLNYGEFGQGYLRQRANSSDVYQIVWDSDILQLFATDEKPAEEIPHTLNFSVPFIAVMDYYGYVIPFYKGLSLDLLPVQPWDPTKCE